MSLELLPRGKRTRPRGFIDTWTPKPETCALLESIDAVIRQYRDFLPLTIRQIFYRLVATADYPKDERGYDRLCELVTTARRARRLRFDHIRDDGFTRREPYGYASPRAFVAGMRYQVEAYRLDRQSGQARRLVAWCEAGGMVPQLESACEDYGVPVYSSGGFDSVTAKYEFARRCAAFGAVEVLHIGDHDPSGVHMFFNLEEDVRAFLEELGGDAVFTRLAVTPEQIEAYGLPTAPRKAKDTRAFVGDTVQAEALPPDVLATTIRAAIEARLDPEIRHDVLAREHAHRTQLFALFDDMEAHASEYLT